MLWCKESVWGEPLHHARWVRPSIILIIDITLHSNSNQKCLFWRQTIFTAKRSEIAMQKICTRLKGVERRKKFLGLVFYLVAKQRVWPTFGSFTQRLIDCHLNNNNIFLLVRGWVSRQSSHCRTRHARSVKTFQMNILNVWYFLIKKRNSLCLTLVSVAEALKCTKFIHIHKATI